MIRFFNLTISSKVNIVRGIIHVFGLGLKRSIRVCKFCSISIFACFDDLSLRQRNALLSYLENNFLLGSVLEQSVRANIKQKIINKTYEGLRHLRGLPVNGQRTKTNAKTSRRLKFKE